MLNALLLVAGIAAGVTGAWSPCGLSMVETLAPHGYAGRLRTSLLACATFALGVLTGGIATFGGLALLGRELGAGGAAATTVALALALAAAVGEARGVRVVPQVRRQVPEAWRRVLPLPVAAGLYGVLLGLGFTTFILSFAVPALAAVSVALGDPVAGLALGVGFGLGRALPVIVLAPAAGTARGPSVAAAMCERPAILRGLRALDALALAGLALALTPASALAADVVARDATDPTADGDRLAWHRPAGPGLLTRDGRAEELPGRHPALGGGRVAWVQGDEVVVAGAGDLVPIARFPAPGADAVAVSAEWVAWRARRRGADAVVAAGLAGGAPRELALVPSPAQLGRPALAGTRVLVAVAGRARTRLEAIDPLSRARTVLRREPGAMLAQPAAHGNVLLYVRATPTRQELRLGALRPRAETARDRVLYRALPPARRDAGHEPGASRHRHGHPRPRGPLPAPGLALTLWSTALASDAAYVTRLRQLPGRPVAFELLRVPR